MEGLMICLNKDCVKQKKQFYSYPKDKNSHKLHYSYLVHPASFTPIFAQKQFFTEQDIRIFQQKLQAQFNGVHAQIITEIERMLNIVWEEQKQSCMQILCLLTNQNEQEFTQKLEKIAVSNDFQNLKIVNAVLLAQDNCIKNEVTSLLQSRIQQFKRKVVRSVRKAVSSLQNESHPQKQYIRTANLKLNQTFQEIVLPFSKQEKTTEMQIECQAKLPSQQQSSKPQIVNLQSQPYQEMSSAILQSKYAQPQSQDIFLSANSFYSNLTSTNDVLTCQNQFPSKEKSIKKRSRRGRPPLKNPTQKIVERPPPPTPTYDTLFKQFDMDSFFPKAHVKDFFQHFTVSTLCRSPKFFDEMSNKVCIRTQGDYQFLRDNPKIPIKASQLTISQKDLFTPQKDLNIPEVFGLFSRQNQLKYLHLKDVLLDGKMDNLKLLLERNVNSLQTLMLQECWQLSEVTEIVSTMRNLRKLKLLSGYLRKYRLNAEHIFCLQNLTCLSLSSAIFTDPQGNQLTEGETSALSNIRRLKNLTHLVLYNCYPVCSDLFGYVHENLHYLLTHLNLAITDVDEEVVPHLKKFENLLELSIDETQLKGKDLINIFEGRVNNPLRQLSLWSLNNSPWKQQKRGFQNGFIKKEEMNKLARLLPNLNYLNIAHCYHLKGYNLFKFPSLRHVCVSRDMYNIRELERFRRSLNVHIDNSEEQALKQSSINIINVDDLDDQDIMLSNYKKEDSDYQPGA